MRRKTTLHEKAIEAGRMFEDAGFSRARDKRRKVAEKEGMRRRHRPSWMMQLDNLNSIYRWLRSHCGQRWNKVNSLLAEELGEGVAAEHIKGHVDQMVVRYPCYDAKNRPCHPEGRWYRNTLITQNEFYVDRGGHLREGRYKYRWDRYSGKDPGIEVIRENGRHKGIVYITEHGKFVPYSLGNDIVGTKFLIRKKDSQEIWKFSKTIPEGYTHVVGPFKPYTA